jgi:hypothetical protein
MERRIMAEHKRPSRLSERDRRLLELFVKHNFSIKSLQAAHPEIPPGDVVRVSAMMLMAMEMEGSGGEAKAPKRKRKGKKSNAGDAYQIKISLKGSKPPIWRRVVVPVEITLDLLHQVIQDAMGWYNCHLHAFTIGEEEYQGRGMDGYWNENSGALDEADYRLCDLVAGEKDTFDYVYDFGDSWAHKLTIEKVIPAAQRPPMMTCLAGKNACPVEDCGGLWGYYNMLRVIADPEHPEHEEVKEWMEEMDQADFDLEKVNGRLAKLKWGGSKGKGNGTGGDSAEY